MKSIFTIILSLVLFSSFAQKNTVDPLPFVEKSFCIILSTKNYAEAKKIAEETSTKTNLKLDLRGLVPNNKTGLTTPKKDLLEGEFFPQYYSRGRYDDGEYVSIEYSDAFDGFTKGFFIVVTCSGNKKEANNALKKMKLLYKTAYVKHTKIYVGCMH